MNSVSHFTDGLNATRASDGSMPIQTRYDGVDGTAGSGSTSKEFEGN